MSEAANWTPDWHLPTAATSMRVPDALALRLRWRLLTRAARPAAEAAALRINRPARPADNQMLRQRWRPMSAPSQPVPPWRWPGRARAERASRRAAISERWRPLTVR
jgi:hypothetical protein